MPQQQRKAGWSALPAQNGEETGGHVELSYVLTCPSPPPLLIFSLTHSQSESKKVSRRKKGSLQGHKFSMSPDTNGKWWQLKS